MPEAALACSLFTACHSKLTCAFGFRYRIIRAIIVFVFFLDFQSWNFDQDWTNTGPEYRIEPSLTCTRVGRHGKYKEWFNSSLQSFDRKINFIDPTFWEILVLTPDLPQRVATRRSHVCVSSGNPGQPALNAGVLTTHNTVEPQTEKRCLFFL